MLKPFYQAVRLSFASFSDLNACTSYPVRYCTSGHFDLAVEASDLQAGASSCGHHGRRKYRLTDHVRAEEAGQHGVCRVF